MSDTFDPYWEWLRIRPHEHPLDHYALLGLARFEANFEIIRRVADERMEHVYGLQSNAHAEVGQRILDELSGAKACLLDSHAKSIYDANLNEKLPHLEDGPLASIAEVQLPPTTGSVMEKTSAENTTASTLFKTSPLLRTYAAPVMGFVAMILIVVLVIRYGDRFAPEDSKRDGQNALQRSLEGEAKDVSIHSQVDGESNTQIPLVVQAPEGHVTLRASTAQLHGGSMRIDTVGTTAVVTGWTFDEDFACWQFQLKKPSFFDVNLTYAVDDAALGTELHFELDGRPIKQWTVRRSGGISSFIEDQFVLALRNNGKHKLKVTTTSETPSRTVRIKTIALTPKKKRRTPP
ncbi:MAG: hypothetical protein MK165_07350 [Pirellulaceae bacterium]|nr:hypothetical protein [Pirellulaceae bacterium]